MRADRQPEFTQIDIEMSFIEREDIYNLVEGLLKRVWKTALNIDVPTPFKRFTFQEAINRYGIDKPDTRFGMELGDFTEEFRGSDGFGAYIAAALQEKDVPVVVVTDKAKADFEIISVAKSEQTGFGVAERCAILLED